MTTASTGYSFVSFTGNYRIDDLLEGTRWGKVGAVTLSYSFPTAASSFAISYGSGEAITGFSALTATQQAAVASALASWSAVAQVQFVSVADNASSAGDLRFAWTRASSIKNSQAYAYMPGPTPEAGDVWLNPDASWNSYAPGSFGFMTLLHEIGHSLGLSHPFDGGLGVLPAAEDSLSNTLMSYTALAGQNGSYANFNPTTPMSYDIAVMQYLYGANTSYHAGNDTYTFVQGSSYFQTIWDAGGIDTIVWQSSNATSGSNAAESATVDLRPGAWSDLGKALSFTDAKGVFVGRSDNTVQIYATVTIENATGGIAADKLIGNDAANVLTGSSGDDVLTGNAGNDSLRGGADFDTAVYIGKRADYTLTFNGTYSNSYMVTDQRGGEGQDQLSEVERLQFSDGSYAVDMRIDDAGGKTALLVGALFGAAGLADLKEVGVVLSYFSLNQLRTFPTLSYGPHSLRDGASFVMNFQDMPAAPGSTSNATFVNTVFKNVVGTAPDEATLQAFVGLLDAHIFSQPQLLAAAATTQANMDRVDLVGLAAKGMLFLPY